MVTGDWCELPGCRVARVAVLPAMPVNARPPATRHPGNPATTHQSPVTRFYNETSVLHPPVPRMADRTAGDRHRIAGLCLPCAGPAVLDVDDDAPDPSRGSALRGRSAGAVRRSAAAHTRRGSGARRTGRSVSGVERLS